MSRWYRLSQSIYSRTMLLVGSVTFLLQLITFSIIFNQMVLPNVHTQVGLFVDKLELVALNPEYIEQFRPGVSHELAPVLVGGDRKRPLQEVEWKIPFWNFVEEELARRFGKSLPIAEYQDGAMQGYYWVDLPTEGKDSTIRIGFLSDREGCLNPPILLLVLFFVVAVSMASVYLLSRWLVQPIDELRMAVGEMGMGGYPNPLPDKGPAEFSSLIQLFNWMVKSVQEMIENRSTLLAGISHDLKTPLARMRLSVEMLSGGRDRDLVEGMVEDLDLMDGMISDSLEYARGGIPGQQQEVDLVKLVSAVVERKVRGGAEIEWHMPEPCIRKVDALALQRILSNYLDNGVQYGQDQPLQVLLHCGVEGVVRIEVINQGNEIPDELLGRVFEPFYRIDASRSEKGGGSGLGLAVVKNLATINGWVVSLESRTGRVIASVEIG